MTLLRKLIREICGVPTDDLDDALATAQLAHFGQTRRSGEAYLEHPKEVARIVYRYYRDQDLCAAALLHDTLEDAPRYGTVQSAEEMASLISASFNDPEIGQEALRIVNRLTHKKGGLPYHAYVLSLLDDPDALKIKLSDMLHNLQSNPSDSQKLKYVDALEALQITAGGIPSGIDTSHWRALQAAAGLDKQSESLIREYVRELLTEAAMGPADIPDGVVIFINPVQEDTGEITVFYGVEGDPRKAPEDAGFDVRGYITILPINPGEGFGTCGGAWMVFGAGALSGWGPMIYDIAMEYATLHGGGLMSDRSSVSKDARKVWDYYFGKRGDVKPHQLDDLKNTLTPDIEEDNCSQFSGQWDDAAEDVYPETPRWVESPLSKRYTKPPTTMDKLRAAGKLVEL